MKTRIKSYKNLTVIATVLSAIFIFPSFISLSVPMLDSFLENGSLYISFFSLPDFVTDNGLLTHLTNISGKNAALGLLILCAILKYMCILSAGLGLYGAIKICVKKKPTRFIFSSQTIALSLSFIAFILVISFALAMGIFSGNISEASGLSEELLDVSFVPTVWFYLSIISSVSSIIFCNKYSKEF